MLGAMLMVALLLVACHTDDSVAELPTEVNAQLTISLPRGIVGKKKSPTTRMSADVVQESGLEDDFRGIDDVHLFCFNDYPSESSSNLGRVIEMKTSGDEVMNGVTSEDYSLCQEITIPVGTSHFAFYGRAADNPQTHEERMHYGIIETVGVDRKDYNGNSGMRFRPVQICPSTEPLGGSQRGQDLLALLNALMNIRGPEAYPNNTWKTVNNLYMNEAYKQMTELTSMSSFHVQAMLGHIKKLVNMEGPDEQGKLLAEAITKKIESCCIEQEAPGDDGQIVLKDSLQGFPEDIHLPAGAARIKWDEEQSLFVIPDKQVYSNDLEVTSVNDYAYPMNLQYQVFSDIVASDSLLVLSSENNTTETGENNTGTGENSGDNGNNTGGNNTGGDNTGGNNTGGDNTGGDNTGGDNTSGDNTGGNDTGETGGENTGIGNTGYQSWQDLLENAYEDAAKVVQPTTQSVAMVKQVQYAVGRLALRTRFSTDNIYDAKGQIVNVSEGMFTLKGYVIGGQREVDYNFQPVEGSRTYAIYDTDLNGGLQSVKRHYFTDTDYILGLGTKADNNIFMALELVNEQQTFQGADGLIVPGATFYLVANLVPKDSEYYKQGELDQVFSKDRATQVYITIKSLANATYGLPNLDIPRPTLGLSVNLVWGEGLWFDEVPL